MFFYNIRQIVLIFTIGIVFISCANKNLKISKVSTILFKTPTIKFYDRGFISRYDNYINLQIYNSGNVVLHLNIYRDSICKGTSSFKCIDGKSFNKQYLHTNYDEDFLYKLFSKNKIYYKNKKDKIFIKVKYDN